MHTSFAVKNISYVLQSTKHSTNSKAKANLALSQCILLTSLNSCTLLVLYQLFYRQLLNSLWFHHWSSFCPQQNNTTMCLDPSIFISLQSYFALQKSIKKSSHQTSFHIAHINEKQILGCPKAVKYLVSVSKLASPGPLQKQLNYTIKQCTYQRG